MSAEVDMEFLLAQLGDLELSRRLAEHELSAARRRIVELEVELAELRPQPKEET